MKVIIFILLTSLLTLTTSNTPYCVFSYSSTSYINRKKLNSYTCQLQIDGEMTNFNDLLATHDQYPNRKNSDVFVLSMGKKANSFIEIFSSIYCKRFRNLKIIDISSSEVATIKPDSLTDCNKLTFLIFYMNRNIEILAEHLLVSNPELQEIHISYNGIKSLPEKLFLKQNKLKVLELSYNMIDNLPNKIFQSLRNLEKLKLDGNKLNTLNLNWFRSIEKLTELNLSQNEIEELPENVFKFLRNLKMLQLHNNKIKFIGLNSFGTHPNLNDMTLSYNELFGIDRNFIRNVPLRKLNMNGNTCNNEKDILRKDMNKKLQQCYEYFLISIQNLELEITTKTTTTTLAKPLIIHSPISTTTTRKTTKSISRKTSRWQSKGRTSKKPQRKYNYNCGIRPSGTALIVNGLNFNPGAYPWMAILVTQNNDVHCGGVLISNRKVLTAGHCIMTKSNTTLTKNHLKVVLGSHDLNETLETSRIAAKIQKIYVHDHWNPTRKKFDSDIAVIVLKYEVDFNDKVHPICLPFNNKDVEAMTMGTVVGYGKTEDNSKQYSKTPKQAQTPIHKLDFCIKKYPNLHSIASRTTFCGGHGNGTGACTGDSGGGLFVSYKNVYYLRGIVSSSLSNNEIGCDVNQYSLYTNVSRFKNWINDIKEEKISTRIGDDDDDDEGNKLWDISSTQSPPSDAYADNSGENYIEFKKEPESDNEDDDSDSEESDLSTLNPVTSTINPEPSTLGSVKSTYEPGQVWA